MDCLIQKGSVKCRVYPNWRFGFIVFEPYIVLKINKTNAYVLAVFLVEKRPLYSFLDSQSHNWLLSNSLLSVPHFPLIFDRFISDLRFEITSFYIPSWPADKGRDESDASFGACDGLSDAEHESQIAVDSIFLLENATRFDSFPSRRQFDQNTLLVDS